MNKKRVIAAICMLLALILTGSIIWLTSNTNEKKSAKAEQTDQAQKEKSVEVQDEKVEQNTSSQSQETRKER